MMIFLESPSDTKEVGKEASPDRRPGLVNNDSRYAACKPLLDDAARMRGRVAYQGRVFLCAIGLLGRAASACGRFGHGDGDLGRGDRPGGRSC